MMTYRDDSLGPGSGDVTSWHYDEASGAMTNKVYADGKGPTYDYTPNGRISRRTWARGVTTDYLYDGWGNLTNKVYSDGTPQVSMLYNAVGRKVAVSDVAGRTFFIYDDFGSLTNETVSGLYGTNTLVRRWDEYGRTVGYDLAPTSAVDGVSYAYDSHGRLSEVSTRFDSDSPDMTFRYEYLPGSDLVAGYSSGDFARKVAFERNRDLVLAVTNSFGSIIISFFDYKNDASGRRCSVRHGGTAYGPLAGSVDSYGYNSRSEVVSSRRTLNGTSVPGFNEDFSYDDIGNRLSAIHYDADGHAIVETYSANELNQYLQRSISDSSGNSLEEYDYDDDGNMTKDGRFHYFWNGENRLVCVSNEDVTIRYEYDWRGRMMEMTNLAVDNRCRYQWDNWNVIREMENNRGSISTTDYVWGLDIVGTVQTTGGIGGFLFVVKNGTTYLPTADINGNISTYCLSDGTISDQRDYSTFGQVLVSSSNNNTGTFTYGFSTKPYIEMVNLIGYEFRTYKPDLGRWMNQDPLSEIGFLNEMNFGKKRKIKFPSLVFCRNNPISNFDILGLAVGKLNAPDPRNLRPSLDSRGHTTYSDFAVSCSCSCLDGAWVVNCDVSFLAKIHVSKEQADEYGVSVNEMYGHEQRHVLSRTKLVQDLVIDGYIGSRQNEDFPDKNSCSREATSIRLNAMLMLKTVLSSGHNHSDEGGDFVNDDSPGSTTGYPPLDGTPDWPELQ